VEIEPGIDGLVHVSDMSWTRRVEHPSEVVQKGQDLEVMVLDVDAENKRISLGIKQIEEDPWQNITTRLAPGVEIEGKVVRVQDKGLVVDLGDDIEGFVPASHAALDEGNEIEDFFDPGDPLDLRVMESDAANRRIVLEVTSTPERKVRPVVEETPADEAEAPEAVVEVAAEAEVVAEAPEAEAVVAEANEDEPSA